MPDNNKDNLFEQYGFSAEKSTSHSPDFGGFMSSSPVSKDTEPEVDTVEEYIAPTDAPIQETDPELNYMANMQNMFQSLAQDTTEPEEPEEVEETPADPEPELSSFLYGKDGDVPVKSQTDLLSSETQPFRSAPTAEVQSEDFQAEEKGAQTEPGTAGSEQQMNTMSNSENKKKPVEKGDEYWSFVDSLLDNFDETKTTPRPRHTEERKERASRKPRAPKVTASEAAAAVAEATSPFDEPAVTTTPEFDKDLLSDFSLGAGSTSRRKERRAERAERKEVPTTSASTATEAEAKSSGEAKAAGGYFLPRAKGEQAKKVRRGLSLSVHDVEETILPTSAEPAAEVAAEAEAPAVAVEPEVEETAEAVLPEIPETPMAEEAPVEVEAEVKPETEPVAPAEPEPVAESEPEEPEEDNNLFFHSKKQARTAEEEEEFFATPVGLNDVPKVEADVEAPVAGESDTTEELASEAEVIAEEVEAPVSDKQAAKEAKAAEKAAAKEAKRAAKEAKAAEKQAAKEAKAAEKAAAKEAKAGAKSAKQDAEVVAEDVVKADTFSDAPVIHEEKTTLAVAPGVSLEDFDENARNDEFDSTFEEPKKKGGALRVFRNVIITLAALAIVACIAVLGYNFAQTRINARQFDQAATLYAEGQSVKNLSAAQKAYPDVDFSEDMDPALAELYAQNQDLVGWVAIPGTTLNYPVVQTDNDTFYQNHNFKKASSPYGTPFLSTNNDASDLDLNNVIYGQNSSKSPNMFGVLENYRDADYFVENPIIEYNTLTESYKFKVYGVFVTNSSAEQDNGYVFDYTVANLGTVDSFAGYIEQINQRRLYDTGVDILSTDKMLTLSTSTDDFDGARLVVVARLVREDESTDINESLVEVNEDPRYPQVWYDENGKENPYTSFDNWIPTIS